MDLSSFRKEILISALAVAAAAEIISIIAIGPDLRFAAGLVVGVATTIVSFMILTKTGTLTQISKRGGTVVLGYFGRMLLYGVAFFFCIRSSVPCGFGCLAGFISLHFGILILYGVVYRFKKKKNPLNDWTEPKEWRDISEDEDEDW